MAIRHLNGWDHFTNPVDKGWIPITSGGATISVGAYGRYGTNGMRATGSTSEAAYCEWLVPTLSGLPPSTWIVGFAARLSGNLNQPFFAQSDGSINQLVVSADSGGRILCLGAHSTKNILPGHYYYIEVKTIIGMTGSVIVRVNGEVWISVSGDTRNGGEAWSDRVLLGALGPAAGSFTYDVDDVAILDTVGGHTTFLGDQRIYTVFPALAGDYQDLTAVGAATSTDATKEHSPDGDTTYVWTDTSGNRESFWTDQVNSDIDFDLAAVQVSAYTRKTEAGYRAYATLLREQLLDTDEVTVLGYDDAQGAEISAADDYQFDPQVFETKPSGGTWRLSTINLTQIGVKVTA